MAVKIEAEAGALTPGVPEVVFNGYFNRAIGPRDYDIAPDGRFLMLKEAGSGAPPRQINLVRNWVEDLRELAPPSP